LQETLERHLPLEGSYNIRDIGGYATTDGKSTRWRTVLRSGGMDRLTPSSQQALLDLGARTILDLRTVEELHYWPSVFKDSEKVNYRHIPVISQDLDKAMEKEESVAAQYKTMLEMSQPQFKEILETIANPEAGITIVHCAAGKDRTGVTIALLLGIANVPAQTIVEDYALSDTYLAGFYNEVRETIRQRGEDPQSLERFFNSYPATMVGTLEYLENKYGGVHQYVTQQLGLSQSQFDSLQARLAQ
jgi:protein-tyrosine phosphatase